MGIFGRQRFVRGLEEPIAMDPNNPLVEEIYRSFPYGKEAFGLRAIVRIVVWSVIEMKRRGFLK